MKITFSVAITFLLVTQGLSGLSSDVDTIELLQQMNESLILGYLEGITSFGPRKTGSPSCLQAGNYVYNEFQQMGLSVRYCDTSNIRNIEATLYGRDTTNIIIICAHYDTVSSSPGADDDASGISAVLSMAKIMSKYTFEHTVRFVCFSGEEQGMVGSRYYAGVCYNNKEYIVTVLNMDMIGYTTTDSNKVNIKVNTGSEWIFDFSKNVSQLYSDYCNIQLYSIGADTRSDHVSFWDKGYDAIQYLEYNSNPYYHTANDTIDKMNIDYTTRLSRLILATLVDIAKMPMNMPPVPEAGSNQQTFVNTEIYLDGSNSSDADGDLLSYTWSVTYKPVNSNAILMNAESMNPLFMADTPGTYKIQLTVNDGKIQSFPDGVEVTITNRAPYRPSNPNPKDGERGLPINITLTWTGGDPDIGDTVTYDVWFGNELPLQKVASNISTGFNTSLLTENITYYWKVVAWDKYRISTENLVWDFTTDINHPPDKPMTPVGKEKGDVNTVYYYNTSATDNEQNQVYSLWDWGDGNFSEWLGPYDSGALISANHIWAIKGSYNIKVKAKDIYGNEGNWSDPLPITMPFSYHMTLLQLLQRFFQRFPHAFPILRYLLGFNQ